MDAYYQHNTILYFISRKYIRLNLVNSFISYVQCWTIIIVPQLYLARPVFTYYNTTHYDFNNHLARISLEYNNLKYSDVFFRYNAHYRGYHFQPKRLFLSTYNLYCIKYLLLYLYFIYCTISTRMFATYYKIQ